MFRQRLLCGIVLVFLGGWASASDQYGITTGNEFLRYCKPALERNTPFKDSVNSIYCLGFVSGYLDGYRIGLVPKGNRPLFCLPKDGVENGQAIRIVIKYLENNPETLHESVRITMAIALGKAFPCRP